MWHVAIVALSKAKLLDLGYRQSSGHSTSPFRMVFSDSSRQYFRHQGKTHGQNSIDRGYAP